MRLLLPLRILRSINAKSVLCFSVFGIWHNVQQVGQRLCEERFDQTASLLAIIDDYDRRHFLALASRAIT